MRARFGELMAVGIDNVPVEDLMLVLSDLKSIDKEFQEINVQTPEAVIDKIVEMKNEIKNRNRAELLRRLKEAKARESALETQGEKRKKARDEITKIEKALEV